METYSEMSAASTPLTCGGCGNRDGGGGDSGRSTFQTRQEALERTLRRRGCVQARNTRQRQNVFGSFFNLKQFERSAHSGNVF